MADKKITVALLLSELKEVKEISSLLKKEGIVPHFYEDLKTFWNGTLEHLPSLCIVDVKKMSEGDLILRNHPAALAEEMPILFYYTDKTEPLLASAYGFYNLGFIKQSKNYEGTLKSALKRVHKMLALEDHYLAQKLVTTAQKEQIERLENQLKMERLSDNYSSMVKNVCLDFEKYKHDADFFKILEKVFQGIDEIEAFSYLELSYNGQKLISPLSHLQKFKTIPSLWLGQACGQGIELFAQNMATQVAVDVMGGDLVSLLIKGDGVNPEKIIFIKSINETFLNNFDWLLLEAYLNGFYGVIKSKLLKPLNNEKKFASSFLAMSFIDEFLFGKMASEKGARSNYEKMHLVNLDLTSLLQAILKKGTNRFYWNHFATEFINKLDIQTKSTYRYFDFGVMNIAFLVNKNESDYFYDQLKIHTQKFSYWKYFEDTDWAMTQKIEPALSMSPTSAHAYLTKILKTENRVKDERRDSSSGWNFIEPKINLDM